MTLAKYVNAWLETSAKKEQNPPFSLIKNRIFTILRLTKNRQVHVEKCIPDEMEISFKCPLSTLRGQRQSGVNLLPMSGQYLIIVGQVSSGEQPSSHYSVVIGAIACAPLPAERPG